MNRSAEDLVRSARSHTIGDLLQRTARRYPDKIALISPGIRWSYAEFDAAVNRTGT